MQDGSYTITEIAPGVYAIDDPAQESMYLVCGTHKALLIDTGSNPQAVTPTVRKLYTGPVELVLTHGHYDHLYHADEFQRVYLHPADYRVWTRAMYPICLGCDLGQKRLPKRYHPGRFSPLADGDVFDLGGKSLSVIEAPGHTPGSVIFVDREDKLLFTGDAFGSGEVIWNWMPGCLKLSAYQKGLQTLIPKLEPMEDYGFYGGHRLQGVVRQNRPLAGPLTLDVARDLETLCGKLLAGPMEPIRVQRILGFRVETYQYGRAALVCRNSKIR